MRSPRLSSAFVPCARFARRLRPSPIEQLGPTTLRLTAAAVAPDAVEFVEVHVSPGVAFGLTVVAGQVERDGTQVLTVCTDADRDLAHTAVRLLDVERESAHPVRRRFGGCPAPVLGVPVLREVQYVR